MVALQCEGLHGLHFSFKKIGLGFVTRDQCTTPCNGMHVPLCADSQRCCNLDHSKCADRAVQ